MQTGVILVEFGLQVIESELDLSLVCGAIELWEPGKAVHSQSLVPVSLWQPCGIVVWIKGVNDRQMFGKWKHLSKCPQGLEEQSLILYIRQCFNHIFKGRVLILHILNNHINI